ncbi:MAG: fibronectin type III domain-containing protein [Acidobacteriota bacterium]|nr:fibronectin type III domain-containing protein [Acidobacteriota bacterium]
MKFSSNGTIVDWFTPSNYPDLDVYDLDLSSSGPIMMPDSNRLVGGGKTGTVYVLDPNALGKNNPPIQSFQATTLCSPFRDDGCYQIHSLAYWNSVTPTLYVWGVNDTLRAYRATGGVFNTTPSSRSGQTASYPGGVLAVSSNGSLPETGILWATTSSGVLHAYDATNVSRELWNSDLNASRDSLGQFSRFGQLIIADGKVFVPTSSNAVVSYGLLGSAPAAPTNLTFTVDFSSSGQVNLAWTDNSTDETGFSIERSTDNVNFAQIATVGSGVTTYNDKSVALYTYYYYRVRSFNASGSSAYSNPVAYFVL